MNNAPIHIKRLQQKSNDMFTVEWSDEQVDDYVLSRLQRNCPCAGCTDETTGKQRDAERKMDEDVRALRIVSVGRYAIRIYYSSGCSTGIYSYELLRRLSTHFTP